MAVYGYAGQILYVNLTTGEIRKEPLDLAMAKSLVGGFGINARLAYDLIPVGVDPFSPENVIIIGAGALSGTAAPASARWTATTKFPQSQAIAYANGSGSFPAQLKYAGYDHLVISGRAAKPVYLYIFNETVELRDASHLWGKDILETTDELWQENGRDSSVVTMGQAGENLVRIALTLTDKVGTCGSGGLGAVMGSKNLKAVVARGTQGIRVAERNKFRRLFNDYIKAVKAWPQLPGLIESGVMGYGWPTWIAHEIPFVWKSGTEAYPKERADELYGLKAYLGRAKKSMLACLSCPLGDKDVLELKYGEDKGLHVLVGGFYQRNENFGIKCDVGSTENVVKCIDMVNRYGIDARVVSRIIDHVVYLYEQGVITDADTGGLALKRDYPTTEKLLKLIAFREGFGDILAEGMVGVIKKFGAEAVMKGSTIKGLEWLWDPRTCMHLGVRVFATVTNLRGPHQCSAYGPSYFPGTPIESFPAECDKLGMTEEAIQRTLDSPLGLNVGRLTRYTEDNYSVFSSLGLCARTQVRNFYNMDNCAEFYSAVTGIELSRSELATAGERAWNLLKAANVREGFSRKDDSFPEKWFEPLITPGGEEVRMLDYFGNKVLTREDCEKLLDDYYDERGWDIERGVPTKDKLTQLGLADVAQDLEKYGIVLS